MVYSTIFKLKLCVYIYYICIIIYIIQSLLKELSYVIYVIDLVHISFFTNLKFTSFTNINIYLKKKICSYIIFV